MSAAWQPASRAELDHDGLCKPVAYWVTCSCLMLCAMQVHFHPLPSLPLMPCRWMTRSSPSTGRRPSQVPAAGDGGQS